MISEKREKKILLLSFISGLMFVIVELIYSIYSHSQSVLMDAVIDSVELVFIALIIFLTPLFRKPVTEKHPYGYYQIESIFLIVKGFMMLSVSLGLGISVIESIVGGGHLVNNFMIAIFQLILGSISLIIYFIMKRLNKKASSPTVDAEILGWKLDVLYSYGLALAFFIASLLTKTPLSFLTPYVDAILALVVMLLMLPENIKMLLGAIKDVFLFTPDEEMLDDIKGICFDALDETQAYPVFFEVSRTGRKMWISIYFEVKEHCFNVKDLTTMTKIVNKSVNEKYDNCTCELILTTDYLAHKNFLKEEIEENLSDD